ncbi:MAG: CatA-like O-acetyltransferase [Clostridiales bacterium]|nr:CatA-like O-acetyltransferase [Clostridiales bacterium]
MDYRRIDLATFPRRAHFEYFSAMADPYVGVTAEVELHGLPNLCRAANAPFFLSFLYAAARAVNAVPELRQRIVEGAPVEFERCDTSHTVMRPDGTYGYCRVSCAASFEDYLPEAIRRHERAKAETGLDDGEDALSLIFVSTLPWLYYTDLRQPTPRPADSNPRVTWGKYRVQNGAATMPVTLLAHHALVDGVHIARFYEELNAQIERLAGELFGR